MSEQLTGLVVRRPVLNFNEAVCERLWNLAEDKGIPRGFIARLLSEDCDLVLLRPYESADAMRSAGVELNEENVDYLASDLEEALAEEGLAGNLTVPTYPASESTPRNRKSRVLFSAAAANPIVKQQRLRVIKAVNQIYGLDKGEKTPVWHDDDYVGGVDVLSIKKIPERLTIVRSLLDITAAALPLDTETGELSYDPHYS